MLLLFDETAPIVLEGFGFGGALLAMFMRVGGGIFTKAADVGADLVGKVEAGIPEDDPRNAATIADNVGDNVGDCAGMAADLFESYAVTLVAALILGQVFFGAVGHGVPAADRRHRRHRLGRRRPRQQPEQERRQRHGRRSTAASSPPPLSRSCWSPRRPSSTCRASPTSDDLAVSPQVLGFVSVLIGVVLAAAIQQLTGYFTETSRKPVKDIGRSSLTGPATVILSGISLGLESAVYAALLIGGAVYGAFLIGGGAALYAVALAGCGLLTTAGVIVAMDTFGPVSDNAQGIAEMSGDIDDEGARVLTDLDAVGNTTKAITKGIAIATAVLAATALFGSYNAQIQVALDEAGETLGDAFSLVNPNNVVGAVLGAAVVFFFSGLAISAVSRAAGRVVFEVREQFRTKPGIMDYTERPDYSAVVDICTKDSLRELATPGLLAVLAPVAVGFGLGIGPLAAYLVGAIAAGTLMAVFLANSGGAWDNAKKMVEDGAYGGKGSEAHAATVIGDTVGDPFKDTAGPAINPLIKVMNLVALHHRPGRRGHDRRRRRQHRRCGWLIALAAVLVIVAAVVVSKRRSVVVGGAAQRRPERPHRQRSLIPARPRSSGRQRPGRRLAGGMWTGRRAVDGPPARHRRPALASLRSAPQGGGRRREAWMCSTISVQLDAVEALAAELGGLAAELDDEADLCRSAARSLSSALHGHEGWTAGATATAWGSLVTVVAARTSAVAATLTRATAAYRAADAALSEEIGARGHGVLEGPR